MNIPSLPTDNLYKFFAIAGIILILASFYLFFKAKVDLDDRIMSLEGETKIYSIEREALDLQFKELRKSVEEFSELSGFHDDFRITDSMLVYPRILKGSPDALNKSREITKFAQEYDRQKIAFRKKFTELETTHKLLGYYEGMLYGLSILAVSSTILGIIFTTSGFLFWYSKLQKHQDSLLFYQAIDQSIINRQCQSCGMRILDDPGSGGSEKDKSHSKIYCSYCYTKGKFIEPDITIDGMKKKVKARLLELKYSRSEIKSYLKSMDLLIRWQRKLFW